MPRKARVRIPGYPLHLVQRGHNRGVCFHDEGEHERYLGLVAEYGAKEGCRIHAYVLMPNHVHMLLSVVDQFAATRMMRHVGQRYAQYINRRYKKTGSAWEGRFWTSIVDSDRYFFTCCKYVELNPVRAGIARHPGDFPWSSFAANAHRHASLIVRPHELYESLGSTELARARAYRQMFRHDIDEADLARIRAAIRGGYPIGDEDFLARMKRSHGIRIAPGKPGRKPRAAEGVEEEAALA
ncbi:MAG TPA: transposase [Usitatibacter sp.]|nr:transposase [Usitatibacter sp.]